MVPRDIFLLLFVSMGILTLGGIMGYIVFFTHKKDDQKETDEKQKEKPIASMIESTKTHQTPEKEEGKTPSSSPTKQERHQETVKEQSKQRVETKEKEVTKQPALPALPHDIPEKYAHLAARDRAFYEGIIKLRTLGLDDDLLYDGMEALWKRYNKKHKLN